MKSSGKSVVLFLTALSTLENLIYKEIKVLIYADVISIYIASESLEIIKTPKSIK